METTLFLMAVIVAVKGGVKYLRSVASVEEMGETGEKKTWESIKQTANKAETAAHEALRAKINRGVAALGAPSPMKGIVVSFRALETAIKAIAEWKDEANKLNRDSDYSQIRVTACALPLSPAAYRALDSLSPETIRGLRPIQIGQLAMVSLSEELDGLRAAWKAADVAAMRESMGNLKGYSALLDPEGSKRLEALRTEAAEAARKITKAQKDLGQNARIIADNLPSDAVASVDAMQFAIASSLESFEESVDSGAVANMVAQTAVIVDCEDMQVPDVENMPRKSTVEFPAGMIPDAAE